MKPNERPIEPPHSLEAENAIVGLLMSDPEAVPYVAGLEPDSFHDRDNAIIFRAIQHLVAAGKPCDPLGVHERLKETYPTWRDNDFETIRSAIEGQWFEPKTFKRYVQIVLDHQRSRQLAAAGREIYSLGMERGDSAKQIDQAQMILAKLAVKNTRREPRRIDESMPAYLQLLEDLSEGRNPAIATGIGGLDQMLNGGLRRGEVMVIGARPKHGKTALSLAIARHMARRHEVLFLSQEMSVNQLMHRHTAAVGQVPIGDILRADPDDRDLWRRITEAAASLGELRLTHDDQSALSLMDIRRKAMAVKRVSGLDVLVVDFLQLMQGAGEESRNRELDVLVNGIKALAMDLEMGVMVLSQMSRKADEHYGRPTMSHLRDSGAIEAAADQVALLHTDWAHPLSKKDRAFRGYSELEIVAHRNGAQGVIPLQFVGELQQFGDWIGPKPVRSGTAAGFE